jgi:hypothetical protein
MTQSARLADTGISKTVEREGGPKSKAEMSRVISAKRNRGLAFVAI